ncbi:MAG: hypothetical protein AAF943_15060 [Pseudomonadota bacterium]
MSENQNSLECNTICWGVAALIGLVAMVMLYLLAEFSGLQAVFTGGLIGTLLGVVLSVFVCRQATAVTDLAGEKPAQRYAREAEEKRAARAAEFTGRSAATDPVPPAAPSGGSPAAAPAPAPAAAVAPASAPTAAADAPAAPAAAAPAAAVSASKDLPGEAELAERKGSWKYEADADGKAADTSEAGDAPSAATKDKAAPATSSEDVAEAAPELFDAAPAEGADDLKLISGVGPKLEQTLNELGIYRFAQVAKWGPSEIAWVDNRLRFKGRIERDDWMSQAKILAEGGETEFSKRNK